MTWTLILGFVVFCLAVLFLLRSASFTRKAHEREKQEMRRYVQQNY
jgi:hypothetical protein